MLLWLWNYMLTHDFAKKKQKKIERERENNEKTMLYIFRYFKEIQKGIFVIKTMFETVLFGLIYVVLNLVRTFYTFSFFCSLSVRCHFKTTSRPAIPKQSCQFALVSAPKGILIRSYVSFLCFFVPLWRLYQTKWNTEVFCLKRF